MKNKKLLFYIAIAVIIILIILGVIFFINRSKFKENLNNQITEYFVDLDLSFLIDENRK